MARRACSCCRLPAALRFEVEDQGLRRHVPVRTISEYLSQQGHPRSRDTVHRHLTLCQTPAPAPAVEPTTAADRVPTLIVALAAADTLRHFPSLASHLAERLYVDGLPDAAEIVLSHVTREYRPALDAVAGTHVSQLLSEQVLARAVGSVLERSAPEVSLAVAAVLHDLGAEELAADFQFLAERATAALHPDTTAPQEASA